MFIVLFFNGFYSSTVSVKFICALEECTYRQATYLHSHGGLWKIWGKIKFGIWRMTVLQEKSIFLVLRDVDFLNFLPKILFLKCKLFAWHVLFIPLFYIHTIDLDLAVDLALAINLGQWLSVWTVKC